VPGIGVLGLERAGLERWLADEGQPRFRGSQLVRWLYQRGADSYEDMTDLPAGLRETLADRLPLLRPRLEAQIGRAHV